MPSISLGEKFSSFDSLKDAIERYQAENNVQLIVKDSKLLGRIAKTMPKLMDVVNKDIIYYRLSYACEYHGIYKARGNMKPNHVSKRRGCPMRILLRLAEDLHNLVVYELFEEHNHPCEHRALTKPPKQQLVRMARVNTSRYMLTCMEESDGGRFVDAETHTGNQVFEDEDEGGEGSNSARGTTTPVTRLIGNATKRVLTTNDMRADNSFTDLKRRRLILQNRKLELETKKLELENKKLELELKALEKRQDTEAGSGGENTFYVSHVIDDSKEGVTDAATSFSSSAAEVIKSLTGRGQPIQIITQ